MVGEIGMYQMLWPEMLVRRISAWLRASGLGDKHATGAAASRSVTSSARSTTDGRRLDTRNSPRWPEERYESCASHTRFRLLLRWAPLSSFHDLLIVDIVFIIHL